MTILVELSTEKTIGPRDVIRGAKAKAAAERQAERKRKLDEVRAREARKSEVIRDGKIEIDVKGIEAASVALGSFAERFRQVEKAAAQAVAVDMAAGISSRSAGGFTVPDSVRDDIISKLKADAPDLAPARTKSIADVDWVEASKTGGLRVERLPGSPDGSVLGVPVYVSRPAALVSPGVIELEWMSRDGLGSFVTRGSGGSGDLVVSFEIKVPWSVPVFLKPGEDVRRQFTVETFSGVDVSGEAIWKS